MLVISLTWKQLFTLDLLFFGKKIWAEALIELQLRQLLVIIPPQCVKRDWRSQWRSTKNQPKPTLQKCSPEISKKGAVFFFKRKCLQRFKNWREEPLKKFWCLPTFHVQILPPLSSPSSAKPPRNGSWSQMRTPLEWNEWMIVRDPNENGSFKMNMMPAEECILYMLCHVQNMNLILDICISYIYLDNQVTPYSTWNQLI